MAAGIFLSRIFGLVRNSVLSHYFGTSAVADAYNVALRIPNVLQNLFGEGALSASFIPVYARLRARGEEEAAGRVAGAVFALLALVTAILVLAGVLATPWLVEVLAPGFDDGRRALTVRLVRIFFPGIGILVLSAWCLGILNSHRRFLLSYSAPVLWNVAIIATLLWYGGRLGATELAVAAAWGSVAGALLQFLVQLPTVLRLERQLRVDGGGVGPHVRTVVRNFGPAVLSRGVVQISAWIDTIIATLLGTGAAAALGYAQQLYVLPVSLFGMSVSAAELPAMSSATGSDDEIAATLRTRLTAAMRRVAFFVVPSAAAFLFLGDAVAAAVLQSGRFTAADSRYVWAILAGAAIGLLATTLARLYSSAFYALRDTRTPMRIATLRIGVGIVAGYLAAVHLPPLLGIAPRWGAAFLTASSGIVGWGELLLLRHSLGRRVGPTGIPAPFVLRLWGAALLAGATGLALKLALPLGRPSAMLVLVTFGVTYLGATRLLRIPEGDALTSTLHRLTRRR
ncbi:MAG TPA: murein biosynthesis integral membrane protein MurJ [Gemmatimonadaceae bacterium]|nr:murein biosynthesis integral membrane protein MurJ [Gemmatimonadaceae bacterium]